jgi:hypothetical protein
MGRQCPRRVESGCAVAAEWKDCFRRMGAVDPPFRRQMGVAPIEPAANGRSTIYT